MTWTRFAAFTINATIIILDTLIAKPLFWWMDRGRR
jgi:hypothetical protein